MSLTLSTRNTPMKRLSLELYQNWNIPKKHVHVIVKRVRTNILWVCMITMERKRLRLRIRRTRKRKKIWIYIMVSLIFLSVEKNLPINVRKIMHIIEPKLWIYWGQNSQMYRFSGIVHVHSQAHTGYLEHEIPKSPGPKWYVFQWHKHYWQICKFMYRG